jgi:hypothetical protein
MSENGANNSKWSSGCPSLLSQRSGHLVPGERERSSRVNDCGTPTTQLRGRRFCSNEEEEISVREWLRMKKRDRFCINPFQKGTNASICWGIVLNSKGNTVECVSYV